VRAALGRAWFVPAPPARVAVVRILVGGYVLWYVGRRRRMLRRIAGGDPGLFRPVGVVSPLKSPLSPAAFRLTLDATQASGVAFLLGWRHAYSGPLFAGLLTFLLTYRNSWSMLYHNDNALVLHVLVLGVAPSADALSLDARRRGGRVPAAGGRYGWPLKAMNAVTVLTYFLAAVAKVRGPLGWGWASGEALRRQIAVDGVRKELLGDGAAPLAYRLYRRVGLFRMLAAGSLAIEGFAPLALADRRVGRAWAVGALSMHWGIYLLMRIKFRYQQSGLMFAPFFPVERAPAVLARLVR
jgi:hypothetical protein